MKHQYSVIGSNNIPQEILLIINILSKSIKETHTLNINISTPMEASAYYGSENNNNIYSPWSNFYAGINKKDEYIINNEIKKELENYHSESYNTSLMEYEVNLSKMYSLKNNKNRKTSFVLHYKGENHNNDSLFNFIKENKIKTFDLSNDKSFKRVLEMIKKKNIDIIEESEKILSLWKKNPPIGLVSEFKNGFTSIENFRKLINKY